MFFFFFNFWFFQISAKFLVICCFNFFIQLWYLVTPITPHYRTAIFWIFCFILKKKEIMINLWYIIPCTRIFFKFFHCWSFLLCFLMVYIFNFFLYFLLSSTHLLLDFVCLPVVCYLVQLLLQLQLLLLHLLPGIFLFSATCVSLRHE